MREKNQVSEGGVRIQLADINKMIKYGFTGGSSAKEPLDPPNEGGKTRGERAPNRLLGKRKKSGENRPSGPFGWVKKLK